MIRKSQVFLFLKRKQSKKQINYNNNQITLIMHQNIGSIRYNQAKGTQQLFECDPKSDFFVLSEERLYPLRKQFLLQCPYFFQSIQKNHRVHVISQKLKSQTFNKVIGCFYGVQCRFERNNEVLQLMKTIKFLEFKQLEQALKSEIIQNFKQYDLFSILQMGYKYGDNEFQQKCFQQLVKMDFEQMNFNRLELLRCEEQIFVKVVKLHQKWKSYGKIKGLAFQDLRKIIEEYNLQNNTKIDILALLSSPITGTILQVQDQQKQQSEIQSLTKIRKCSTFDDFEKPKNKHIIKITHCNTHCKNKMENIYQYEDINSNLYEHVKSQNSYHEIAQLTSSSANFNGFGSQKIYLKRLTEVYFDDDDMERTTSPKSQEIYHSQILSLFEKSELDKSLDFLSKIQKINSQEKSSNRKSSSRKKSMMQKAQNTPEDQFNQKINFQSRLFQSQQIYFSNTNQILCLNREIEQNL